MIPRGVRFIHGSVFHEMDKLSMSNESGNEKFVTREKSLIDIVDRRLIRNLSRSSAVVIPRDIEILGSACFAQLRSFGFVLVESNLRFWRIKSKTLPPDSVRITIRFTVLFVAHEASPERSRLSLYEKDSCPEFDRWRRLRESGTAVNFRRSVRGDGCARLRLDLTGFEEGSMIGETSRFYRRGTDGIKIVVEAFAVL
jgi:hypothetical protein